MEIPIFPLNTVLFPGATLPLHIFEERYKQMIAQCLEDQHSFGVVLIRSGGEVGATAEPFDIGAIANISNVERLDDGKMNLICRGGERFRIVKTIADTPYLKAEVELIETATESDPATTDLADEATTLFAEYTRLYLAVTNQWSRTIDLPGDPQTLGDFIGSRLPVAPRTKQKLLEELSAATRLDMEKRLLGAAIRQMTSQVRTARDARWHGLAVMN
ncbi:MAG: LON peptidase substrate-binding domain-containing protein [Chloroflexi bacterium]|nr:LON peptidase substrate-binding domain-containing protein [Chloroflexota bacterium]